MKTYLGNRIDNLLAIQLQDDAQNTVRAGVLWPHVQEDEVRALTLSRHAPLFRTKL